MDQKIARWAQLAWMDPEKVDELHRREKLWATRSEASGRLKFEEKGMAHWMDLRWIAAETMRISPNGYWPRDMSQSEQSSSMAQFEALIYPLWKRVEARDKREEECCCVKPEECKCVDAEKALHAAAARSMILLDCLTLHRQDLAIHVSGIKPTRQAADYAKAIELRRKATKAERGNF